MHEVHRRVCIPTTQNKYGKRNETEAKRSVFVYDKEKKLYFLFVREIERSVPLFKYSRYG